MNTTPPTPSETEPTDEAARTALTYLDGLAQLLTYLADAAHIACQLWPAESAQLILRSQAAMQALSTCTVDLDPARHTLTNAVRTLAGELVSIATRGGAPPMPTLAAEPSGA